MRLLHIDLRDVYSHRHTVLDLRQVDRVVIAGPNDSGKSSLLDAIFFAFFGAKAARNKLERVIRFTQEEARAQVVYALGGQTYRIIRLINTRKKHLVTVQRAVGTWAPDAPEDDTQTWVTEFSGRVTDTNAQLAQHLGFTYEEWLATAYWDQGKEQGDLLNERQTKETAFRLFMNKLCGVDGFREHELAAGRLTKGFREQELSEATLALDEAISARDLLTAAVGSSREEVAALRESLASASAELERAKASESRQADVVQRLAENRSAAEVRAAKQGLVDNLREQVEELARECRGLGSQSSGDISVEIAEVASRIQTLSSALDARRLLPSLRETLAEALRVEEARQASDLAISALREEIEVLAENLREVQAEGEAAVKADRLLQQRPAECAIDHCAFIRAAVRDRRDVDALRAQKTSLQDEIAVLREKEAQEQAKKPKPPEQSSTHLEREIEDAIRSSIADSSEDEILTQKSTLEARHAELSAALVRRQEAARKAQRLTKLRADLDAEVIALEALPVCEEDVTPDMLQAERSALRERQAVVATAERARDSRRDELAIADRRLATHEASIGAMSDRIKQAEGRLAEVKERAREALVSRYALDFFREAPVMASSRACGALTTYVNQTMADIAPRYRFSIEEDGERLSPVVHTASHQQYVNEICGSGKERLGLCFRFGMSQVIAARSGVTIDTWIFDEPGTALDAEHRDRVREFFELVASRVGLVMVISHLEELQGLFDSRIVCRRISEFECVAELTGHESPALPREEPRTQLNPHPSQAPVADERGQFCLL